MPPGTMEKGNLRALLVRRQMVTKFCPQKIYSDTEDSGMFLPPISLTPSGFCMCFCVWGRGIAWWLTLGDWCLLCSLRPVCVTPPASDHSFGRDLGGSTNPAGTLGIRESFSPTHDARGSEPHSTAPSELVSSSFANLKRGGGALYFTDQKEDPNI